MPPCKRKYYKNTSKKQATYIISHKPRLTADDKLKTHQFWLNLSRVLWKVAPGLIEHPGKGC